MTELRLKPEFDWAKAVRELKSPDTEIAEFAFEDIREETLSDVKAAARKHHRGDGMDHEDIVQNVYARIWEIRADVPDDMDARYVVGAVRNYSIWHRRDNLMHSASHFNSSAESAAESHEKLSAWELKRDAAKRDGKPAPEGPELNEWQKSEARAYRGYAIPHVMRVRDHTKVVECREAVRIAMDALKPKQRALITLVHLREMSIKDAAEELGITAGYASEAVKRWLPKMRAALESAGITGPPTSDGVQYAHPVSKHSGE